MQRSARHHRASHRHGHQLCHRREFAGASHLHRNVAQQRGFFLGREFESNGPTRRTGRETHGVLLVKVVHLHHHAVNVVGKRIATLQRIDAKIAYFLGFCAQLHIGIHMKTRRTQPLQQLPLAAHIKRALVGNGVHERCQIALRRNTRVFLAKRSCRCITRIRETLLARQFGFGVQRGEAAFGHVDFAAQLKRAFRARDKRRSIGGKRKRNVGHAADVHGHVFAGNAIAARGGAHQAAVVVRERNG